MSRAQLTSMTADNVVQETLVGSTGNSIKGGSVAPFVAGKNKIINGDFNIWQRGTSFSSISSGTFTADRWFVNFDGSGATRSVSQQTFTPGSAPVAGYESSYFLRLATTVAGSGQTYSNLAQRIENVQTFANQTVVVSFWAKANAAISLGTVFGQNFGSGGSSSVYTVGPSFTLSTSWARYTGYITLPSISGKTVGTGSYLELDLTWPQNSTFTLDVWGVQLEAGSVATPFTTASGTFQGELAAAQRYFAKSYDVTIAPGATTNTQGIITSSMLSVANGAYYCGVKLPVTMRTDPTVNIYSFGSGTIGVVSNASGGGDFPANTGIANTIGHSAFSVYNNSGSTVTSSAGFIFHYSANAEL